MCPVCGTPLGLADRGAAGQPRARATSTRLVDSVQVEGRGEGQRSSPSSATDVLASPGDKGFGLAAYLVSDRPCCIARVAGASPSPPCAGAAGGPPPRRPARCARPLGRAHRAPRPRHGALRPLIVRRRLVDATVFAAFARRLHLVRLPLRAAARARLPLGDLGRLLRRAPGRPRRGEGARAGAPLLPLVHRDVRRRSAWPRRASARRSARTTERDPPGLGRAARADGRCSSSARCSSRCSTASGGPTR